jgi:hypothetical protein
MPLSSTPVILQKLETLSSQVEELRRNISVLRNQPASPVSILPLNPIHGIEVVPKREVVLGEPNSLSMADRLLLNRNAKKALEAEEMGASRNNEYPLGEEDEVEEDDDGAMEVEEEQEAEEAEEEQAEEAEAAEAEAEAEEAAAEEAAEELEEFEYKGNTFYRDSENNVFMTDEDGDLVDEPIGTWNAEKKKIMMKKA